MEDLGEPLLQDKAFVPPATNGETSGATTARSCGSLPANRVGPAPRKFNHAATGLGETIPRRFSLHVIDRLQDAQAKLIHEAEDRHAIYSPTPPALDPGRRCHSTTKQPVLRIEVPPQPTSHSPLSSSRIDEQQDDQHCCLKPGDIAQRELPKGFSRPARAASLNYPRDRSTGHAVEQTVHESSTLVKGIAYMGIDWYQVAGKKRRLSWLFFIEHLYFWCYAGYISGCILMGAVLMWALEPDGRLSFAQSIFSAAACVSQSGLAVVDWSEQARSTYIISFVLILAGSASLLHMVPVVLRRLSFRQQTRLTLKWLQRSENARRNSTQHCPDRDNDGDLIIPSDSLRRTVSDPITCGPGNTQEGSPVFQQDQVHANKLAGQGAVQQSDPEPKGTKGQYSAMLSEMHRLEYKALGMVLRIMLGYWLTVQAIGWVIFVVYFKFGTGHIVDKFRREGLAPWWTTAYMTVSSFQNNGLVMTPSSVMDFRWSPLLLSTIAALILCGNTGIPIAVRFIAWLLAKHAPPGSEREHVLDFLLEHPRRCFTHMFPAAHTLWLLLVCFFLILFEAAVIMWQDSDGNAFTWHDELNNEHQLGMTDRLCNSFFTAVSTRTAGLNSINIANLSPATTFLMVVMMYFSTTPTVVTMRLSAASGAGELDITGRAEGVDEEVLLGNNSLKSQARRYLTQDILYLIFMCFIILVLEKDKFIASTQHGAPESDGLYGDFTFFKVFYELASAYGTCGYSLGYRNQIMSFSGVWSAPSQYLLVIVMILGRLRGLPDSIDPSVRVAMPHGENAEHAFMHA